jgi:hypothetical protein
MGLLNSNAGLILPYIAGVQAFEILVLSWSNQGLNRQLEAIIHCQVLPEVGGDPQPATTFCLRLSHLNEYSY